MTYDIIIRHLGGTEFEDVEPDYEYAPHYPEEWKEKDLDYVRNVKSTRTQIELFPFEPIIHHIKMYNGATCSRIIRTDGSIFKMPRNYYFGGGANENTLCYFLTFLGHKVLGNNLCESEYENKLCPMEYYKELSRYHNYVFTLEDILKTDVSKYENPDIFKYGFTNILRYDTFHYAFRASAKSGKRFDKLLLTNDLSDEDKIIIANRFLKKLSKITDNGEFNRKRFNLSIKETIRRYAREHQVSSSIYI